MGLYDAKQKKGAVYNHIKNQRKAHLKNILHKRTAETSICESSQVEMNEQEKENVKNFLRTCHLPNNKRLLEEKLIESKTYRRELIEDAFDEYKEMWNFYFACPTFVSILFNVCVE